MTDADASWRASTSPGRIGGSSARPTAVPSTPEEGVDAFDREKDRQSDLERLGLVVVRWGARHLVGPAPAMVQRIRRLSDAPPAPLTGSLAQVPLPYTG